MSQPKKWIKALAANDTSNAFASVLATTTEPVLTATHAVLNALSGMATLKVLVFGAGADNATTAMRIFGWEKNENNTVLWLPTLICEVDAILSGAVGIAGAGCINTDRFADSLVNTNSYGVVLVPTVPADHIASVEVDITGFEKVSLIFKRTTATNTNALYCATE